VSRPVTPAAGQEAGLAANRDAALDISAGLDVSIVLPVYNEAAHLGAELDRIGAAMGASPYSWELIVVDDGSTDDSADRALGRACTRVIRSPRRRGAGAARRIGTEASIGRVVVWSDADMSYPNDRIPELVEALDGFDQVVGARTSEQGTLKALRRPAKWAICRLASFLTRVRIPDLNSGLRAFRRDVALQYTPQLPNGFSCVTTLTVAFLMNGYRIRWMPIPYGPRAGRSKFRPVADTRRYLLQLIRMAFTYDPLRAVVPVAGLLGALFAAKLGYDLAGQDSQPGVVTILLGAAMLSVLFAGVFFESVVRTTRRAPQVRPADLLELSAGANDKDASATTRSSDPPKSPES